MKRVLPGKMRKCLYVLQDYCAQQKGKCGSCEMRYVCASLWRGEKPAELELPRREEIILGCEEKDYCTEYILMYSEMSLKVKHAEEEMKKAQRERDILKKERNSLWDILERLCPDWKYQINRLRERDRKRA